MFESRSIFVPNVDDDDNSAVKITVTFPVTIKGGMLYCGWQEI